VYVDNGENNLLNTLWSPVFQRTSMCRLTKVYPSITDNLKTQNLRVCAGEQKELSAIKDTTLNLKATC
jgi:hypothetical protein